MIHPNKALKITPRARKGSVTFLHKPRLIQRRNKVNLDSMDSSIADQRAYEFLIRELEAKNWVEKVLNEELQFSVADFVENLRDGILLCKLGACFAPNIVNLKLIRKPKIGSVLEFMAIENYNIFFKACESIDFPSIYCFEVPNLWERKNPFKVVHCLHMLAHFVYANRLSSIQIEDLFMHNIVFSKEELEATKNIIQDLDPSMIPSFFSNEDLPEEAPPHDEDQETPFVLDEDLEWADPDNCKLVGTIPTNVVCGQVSNFSLQAYDIGGVEIRKGGEQFTAALTHKDDGTKVYAQCKDLNNGRYEFSFTLENAGNYDMNIVLVNVIDENDRQLIPVQCGNIAIHAEPAQADLTRAVLTGNGITSAIAAMPTSFTLQTFDSFGNKCQTASSNPSAFLVKKDCPSQKVDVQFTDEGQGGFKGTYVCPQSGNYELHVMINGEQLSQEPKSVQVKDMGISDPHLCQVILPPIFDDNRFVTVKAGDIVEFTIQAKDKQGNLRESGGEIFTVQSDSNNLMDNHISVVDRNDGKYTVKFEALNSGNFPLSVKLGDTLLPVSPITVNVTDEGLTIPTKCTWHVKTPTGEIQPSFSSGIRAGSRYEVIVEPRDRFGNKRSVLNPDELYSLVVISKITGDQVYIQQVSGKDMANSDGTVKIPLTLHECGDYALQLLWQDSVHTPLNITGYPCHVNILDSGVTEPSKLHCFGDVEKNKKLNEQNDKLLFDGFSTAYNTLKATFTIETHDSYGNARTTGGDQLSVRLANEKLHILLDAAIQDNHNGTYDIFYTPTKSGYYQIKVEVNGIRAITDQLPLNVPTLLIKPFTVQDIEDMSMVDDHDLLHSVTHALQNEEQQQNLLDELQTIRDSIVKQIRINTQVEVNVKDLDRRIQLLAQNRVIVDDLLHSPRGIFGLFARKHKNLEALKKEGIHVSSPWKDPKRMELYSKFFYLLQTNPHYLSQCLWLVPQEKVDGFLETVILSLYGYAYSPREEFLLLKLFQYTLEIEINKSNKLGSFLIENPVLPKMVNSYTRRLQGRNFLQKILIDKLLVQVLQSDKELNLDLTVSKMINRMNSGPLSRLPSDLISPEKALEDESISTKLVERISKLIEICHSILEGLVQSVDDIPFGIRWICKQLDALLQKKHPESTENERATIIGYMAYYRFMNPALISPEIFGLNRDLKISMVTRNNLVIISKVLTNLSNNVMFENKTMAKLNEWIKANRSVFVEKFIRRLIQVGEPEDVLGVNQYMELTYRKSMYITINWNEILSTHELFIKYMNKIIPDKDDPLRDILTQLGPILPEELPHDRNEDISLPLTPILRDQGIEMENDSDSIQQLYTSVKVAFCFLLKHLPVNRLVEDVIGTLDSLRQFIASRESHDALEQQMHSKLDFIEQTLPKLVEANLVSKKDKYRKLLSDVTEEIQNRKVIQQKQQQELLRLQGVLRSLQEHHQYLKTKIAQFENYIEDARRKNYQTLTTGASRKKKYTYRQLRDRGIIAEELDIPNASKLNFVVYMPEPGVVAVEAKLTVITVKTIRVFLDDLLERQSKNIQLIQVDNVSLDVTKTLHLINTKFAAKVKK